MTQHLRDTPEPSVWKVAVEKQSLRKENMKKELRCAHTCGNRSDGGIAAFRFKCLSVCMVEAGREESDYSHQ